MVRPLLRRATGEPVLGATPAGLAGGAGGRVPAAEVARRRLVAVVALLAVLGACAVPASAAAVALGPATPARLAAISLDAAVVLLVVLAAYLARDADRSLRSVLRDDASGQRRWEVAEAELSSLRRIQEGHDHDISSTLAAVSGALLVLQHRRAGMSDEQVDRLTSATREQIQSLRALLASGGEDPGVPGAYDVTAVVATAAALRRGQPHPVICAAEPDLWARGRSDRLAIVVNNLLANAALHAPSARVALSASPGRGARTGTVEVVVSDDGPGIAGDLTRPLERGWRGRRDPTVPGSGLGLSQCRELVEAEGGAILLTPTDVTAPEGRCGLSVHVWVPAAPSPRRR